MPDEPSNPSSEIFDGLEESSASNDGTPESHSFNEINRNDSED
jgi:hypothetical protein